MSAQTAEQACARWRMTISINDLETPATTGFLAGHASRDAEVTALVAERTSLWGSVTKYAAEVAELRAKLTEAERLNKVALEAMKKAAQVTEFDYEHESAFTVCCGARFDKRGSDDQPNEHADDCYLNSAIIDMSAPIPPTPNQRQFDLLNQAHERSVAECIRLNAALQKYENGSPMLLNAVPPPPTPSQEEALKAVDDMASLLATDPMTDTYFDRISIVRDFILARPDTEGSGK